jgi:S-adenosylmethionine/arginine decarboxylase-like enzyme
MKQYDSGMVVKFLCRGCKETLIDDRWWVEGILLLLCSEIEMTKLAGPFSVRCIKEFENEKNGVSAVLVIEESHIAFHCWTLAGAVNVVIDSCKEFDVLRVEKFLKRVLKTDLLIKTLQIRDV